MLKKQHHQHGREPRVRALSGSIVVGVLFVVSIGGPALASPQAGAGVYRISAAKESKFQEELDRMAADGYRLIAGDAGIGVVVWERATDGTRRSYVFAPDVDKFLEEKRLQAGYRLVVPTFGGDADSFSAVFEKLEADVQVRDYGLIKARSSGALGKRFEQASEGTTRAVAVAWSGSGVAAIYERDGLARPARIVSSGNSGTLEKELRSPGAAAGCVVDGDGVKEALYLLEPCAEGAGRGYEVIATTKGDTFEKELNAAAVRGMRLVPASVVNIEKRVLMMSAYNIEIVGVLEPATDRTPITYRVLGTLRLDTLERELQTAAAGGFRLLVFTVGPKEKIAVMARGRR